MRLITIEWHRVMGLQLAKATTEGDVLPAGQMLVAQQQQPVVFEQRGTDRCEVLVTDRPTEVQSTHLHSERIGQRRQFNGHGRYSFACYGSWSLSWTMLMVLLPVW